MQRYQQQDEEQEQGRQQDMQRQEEDNEAQQQQESDTARGNYENSTGDYGNWPAKNAQPLRIEERAGIVCSVSTSRGRLLTGGGANS